MNSPVVLSTALLLGLLPITWSEAAHADAPSARDIMVKSEEAGRVGDITSSATMTTGEEGGSTKSKTFSWSRKLDSDKIRFRTLTRFLAPAEVRGEGILIAEHDSTNDVQLYLPTFKKIRRVDGQSQSTSFMGTTFSYSDMTHSHASDYKHTLLRTEPCPREAAIQCYVVSSVPANDAVRDRTGYSKVVEWVRSDNYVVGQSEMFDSGGKLAKRLVATHIKEVDTSAHKWFAHEVRIEDLRVKKYTLLQFTSVKANVGVAESTFSAQNLARE